MTDEPRSVDDPTVMNPSSGHLSGGSPDQTVPDEALTGYGRSTYDPIRAAAEQPPPDEPTLAEPTHPESGPGSDASGSGSDASGSGSDASGSGSEWGSGSGSTAAGQAPGGEEATLAQPAQSAGSATAEGEGGDEATGAEAVWTGWPSNAAFSVDGPTVAEPVVVGSDEVTLANEEPTTTGPTVGGWPLDQFEAPPLGELVWQPDSASVAPPPGAGRRPAYYVLLGAAVVLVVGLVAFAALVTVRKPTQAVAGTGSAAIPVVTSSSQAPTSSGTSSAAPPVNPYAELARHPLSTETTRMPDVTCVLPRFDLPDDRQAAFFQAAKVCADDAWRPVLAAAGLDDVQVRLVTVTGAVQTQSCGELAPTSPPTSCDGTVYMTPAYLRDTEQLGRYPGKYFGVFLREYARAVQFGAGLEQLASAVPDGSADIDTRLDQQATCLAGMTSGAMAGRGDVDDNITGEIRQRLSSVDAPPDAESLLDKGFQQRAPAACNTWAK